MVRTQIHLPNELYERAKRFSEQREMSLAEVMRRGLETLLDRYQSAEPVRSWQLPIVDGGSVKVPLEALREFAAADEDARF